MGNCVNTPKHAVRRQPSIPHTSGVRIRKATHCPNCNKYFSGHTTLHNFNNHLDQCLSSQNSNSTASSFVNQQQQTLAEIAKNSNGTNNKETFLWVKKLSTNNQYIWVKQKSKASGENSLLNLSPKDIQSLGFEEKKIWFRAALEKLRISWTKGADYLRVERSELLNTSAKAIRSCNLLKEVKVEFRGDEKINDAGGLMREWMSLIVKELVRPDLELFVKTDSAEVSYSINPNSPDIEKILDAYEFAGKVVGKAIFERITLDMHFDNCLLRALVGKLVTLEDLKSLDAPLYNSLNYLLKNKIDGSEIFQEHFVVPNQRATEVIELCDQGISKRVTDQNKSEYVKLLVEWYGQKRIQKKINAFIKGITSCIPAETLTIFELHELEMIINGVPFINLEDWESNTIYKGSYFRTHKVIGWFWKILKEMKQEDLSKLLQFCTGSSRTPVEGFRYHNKS